jgi:hypothetical protein
VTAWIRVDVDMIDNEKIVALSSDSARWAALVAYTRSKVRKPQGHFKGRAVLEHHLGRYAEHIDELIGAGILEVAPRLCRRCRTWTGRIRAGTIVVHDFDFHQPSSTERVREWRARNGGLNGHQTLTGNRFPEVSPGDTQPFPSSRARALSPSLSNSSDTTNEGGGPGEGDEPEGPALTWLAQHGCHVQPGNGYHRRLIAAAERHGVIALIRGFEAAAKAGIADGDVKGFVFAAIDALDAGSRPDLRAVRQAATAASESDRVARGVEATRRHRAELEAIGHIAGSLADHNVQDPGGRL